MCPTSRGRIIRECITTERLHSLAAAKTVTGPSEPTKYFLFLFYFKCPDVGMECEVWLEKSFYEIIKVERWSGGHLKSNYGYLESSLDISAFHYLVQTGFSRQNKWRLNGDLSLLHIPASVRGWRANYTANKTAHSTQLSSTNHLSSFVSWQLGRLGPFFKLTAADF